MQLIKCPLNAIVYRLKTDDNDPDRHKCGWADFTLEFDFRRLSIRSDSGDYAYSWGHSDNDSILNLLSRVSKEYLLSKISDKNIFDIKTSKEQLIEYVKHNEESYGVDNIEDIIKNIKDIPELLTEESYLYHVKDIIPKIDWEAIPIEKAYPYNAQVVSEMFINYVQPQIKNDFEERKKSLYIYYTNDNEPMAIEEIKNILNRIDNVILLDFSIKEAKRACRNANGKEMDEEGFDSMDADDKEVWFDDYDFTFLAVIETPMSIDELIDICENEGLSVENTEEANESED